MEVAKLTATLEAEIARFSANMKEADRLLDNAKRQITETESATEGLARSLESVQLSNTKIQAAVRSLKSLQDAETGAAVAARSDVDALNDVGNAAVINAAKVKTMSEAMSEWSRTSVRGAGGQFVSDFSAAGRGGYPGLRGPGGRYISQAEWIAMSARRTDALMRMNLAASGLPYRGGSYTTPPPGIPMGPASVGPWSRHGISALDLAMIAAAQPEGPGWFARAGGLRGMGRSFGGFMGWGGGRGIWGPSLFGWGRGGWGLRRWFPGMAGFGSMAGLAGFGAERFAGSLLGIGGSMLGGLAGGGLLGMGALGTSMVGMGTNMAGMGQAAGDIHTVSSDLGALSAAIRQYGKNSTQAANAQSQLNADLGAFSPVAKNAVLAASQTSQQFKAMFDKLTGPAEKIGAEIINQAQHVGEKFLPTIGKYAHQNMGILQRGLQPFFKWLGQGGLGGGLGIFKDLEKTFQKNFPTSIHAGEQGFELLIKTIDIASHHLGGFMAKINDFFTKMNGVDFSKWKKGVNDLIGLFHSWAGLFGSIIKDVYYLSKPMVGLGKAFADSLHGIFNQIGGYLKQKGTYNILNSLFSAHLMQVIQGIGGAIKGILPFVEDFLSAFFQMESKISQAFAYILAGINGLIHGFDWINNKLGGIPGKILGWAVALKLVFSANSMILRVLAVMSSRIPIIGTLFANVFDRASKGITQLGIYIGNLIKQGIVSLIAWIKGIGTTATASAAEADTAIAGIGAASTTAAGEVGVLEGAEIALGPAAVSAEAEAVPALAAIGAAAMAALGPIAALLAAVGAAVGIGYAISRGGSILPSGATNQHGVGGGAAGQIYQKNGKWYEMMNVGKFGYRTREISAAEAHKIIGQGHARVGASHDFHGAFQTTNSASARGKAYNAHQHLLNSIKAQQQKYQKMFGTPSALPSGISAPSGGGGGGSNPVTRALQPHVNALNAAATRYAQATTGLPSISQMNASQAHTAINAATKYLAVLHQQMAAAQKLAQNAKDRARALREERSIASQIKSVTHDRLLTERQLNTLVKARKQLALLKDPQAGNFTTLGIKQSLATAKQMFSQMPSAVTPQMQHLVDVVNKILKQGIASPTVRSAIRQKLQAMLSDMQQALSNSLQELQSQADSNFQQNTQDAIDNMQVMVHSSAGDFMFGGSITQTPAQIALQQLQASHDAAQNQLALTQAQQDLIQAQASGDPQQILSAQQALADAQYQIQVAQLQSQADIQQTAADKQLQAAQVAYQKQRDLQQQAMDQQIQDYENLMQQYPDKTSYYLGLIAQTYSTYGVNWGQVALNGMVTGFQQALDSLNGTGGGSNNPPPSGTPTGGNGQGGGACFVAGTMVLTPDGRRPIEDLEVGDEVFCWSFGENKLVPTRITEVFSHENDDAREVQVLTMGNGEVLVGTPEHMVYGNKKWSPLGDADCIWSPVSGKDELVFMHGSGGERDVYNIHVEHRDHNYVANGFLVHNVKIKGMATGGYVPARYGGTLALLAEGGEGEYVVPESRIGGSGTLHVTHNITVQLDGKTITREVRDELIRIGKSNKSIFSGPNITP